MSSSKPNQTTGSLVVKFDHHGVTTDVWLDLDGDTVWLSQQQIADLYGVDQSGISRHIKKLLATGEIEPDMMRCVVSAETGHGIDHYNLDAILLIGFACKSPRASSFRKWAGETLRDYLVKGYAVNQAKLANDHQALVQLADQVRALRTSEKHVSHRLREALKLTASDYDADSDLTRRFFALLRDKVLYAITDLTAAGLVLDRCDHVRDHLGLQTWDGKRPGKADARIGTNYLTQDELWYYSHLTDLLLLQLAINVRRGITMTMDSIAGYLDRHVSSAGYQLFPGYQRFDPINRRRADQHADDQHGLYLNRMKQVTGPAANSIGTKS